MSNSLAPQEIIDLVNRFETHKTSYKDPTYNETMVRRDFIDPLFKALGWDIDNKEGLPEAYRDVIHEDSIKVGGFYKAPDYCFKTGGMRRFFVEAKKPSINLKDDPHPAFQLKRYAWSAKLPVGILTDFEEFVVYDTRQRPKEADIATKNRFFYCRYDELVDRWDEIESLFSKSAVQEGSLEAFVELAAEKKGTDEVDQEFLKEIENWRELITKDIAINNNLTQRELNYAVQKIIDRIIFLRISEDRGIENYGRLLALQNKPRVYESLCEIFEEADRKYNSGLFHFREEKGINESPDALTSSLKISDEVLKKIISNLYYPNSPYEFSVLPADVLGQIYEQFLGKVIRLTDDHEAVIEDKPEVKKAGGVFYTPTYIVEYIVKNTVGKLVDGKNIKQVEKIKILDPACGSGSFLLGAYQYLLDWHLEYYVENRIDKYFKGKNPVIYQAKNGDWRLTIPERKRILVNNIFGVDIDPQAVEVTKLSLLLKVLEGVGQLSLFSERVLPDLGKNIKCGNSLIETDFYQNDQKTMFGVEERYRINVFDWDVEFKEIYDSGKFDAIIGNPPWISLTGRFGNDICTDEEVRYLIKKFNGNTYMPNLYEYFVALGLDLVKKDGLFSFIVPDRLGFNEQFVGLRKKILREVEILNLVYKMPFPKVVVDTLTFTLRNRTPNDDSVVNVGRWEKEMIAQKQFDYEKVFLSRFEYYESSIVKSLVFKIESKTNPLYTFCETTSGFGGKSKLITKNKINDLQIAVYKGDSVGKYSIENNYWFEFKKNNITGRTTDKNKLGAKEKILLRKTGNRIIATYDVSGYFPEQSLYFLYDNKSDLSFKYLLGVLNSKLMNFFFKARSITNEDSIAQIKKDDLDLLPIKTINFSQQKFIIQLVDEILTIKKNMIMSNTDQEKSFYDRELLSLNNRIDDLIYRYYELSEEEIRIIENSVID